MFRHSKGCLEAWLGALINLVTTKTMAATSFRGDSGRCRLLIGERIKVIEYYVGAPGGSDAPGDEFH